MINWIRDNFGGDIAEANSNTSYGKKLCLRVCWNGKKAIPILRGIQPYLLTKKSRLTELALVHIDNERNLEFRSILAEAGKKLNSS